MLCGDFEWNGLENFDSDGLFLPKVWLFTFFQKILDPSSMPAQNEHI